MTSDRVARILDDARGCRRPLEQATGLPAAAFTDPEWYAAEQRHVFAKAWTPIARSTDLAEPGSYAARTIADEPVVATRDRDGELHALSNACLHRGTLLCEGRGSAPSLACPNHAWTFALDGRLRAAPHMADGFDPGSYALPAFAVAEWQGWVMVNLDRAAAPPETALAGLDALLEGHEMHDLVSIGEMHYPSPWNWKVSVENFIESYHHRPVHPETLDETYPGARSFSRFAEGEHWAGVDHESVVEESEPFYAGVVFPSFLFALLRGGGVTWFDLVPLGPDRCHLRIDVLVKPELAADLDYLVEVTAAINEEDIGINEATWAGMQSAHYVPGPVSPLEGACWSFRRWLLDAMTPGS